MNYIALLRGINVSGQKKIKMAELRQHLAELDLKNIQTYIQSGNIIFESTSDKLDKTWYEQQIAAKIKEKYDFDVPVLVLTVAALENAVSNHLYSNHPENDRKACYYTFLATAPTPACIKRLLTVNYPNEFFTLDEQVVYCFYPNGYGRSKLNNNKIEALLKVKATSRNDRTCRKILDMVNKK